MTTLQNNEFAKLKDHLDNVSWQDAGCPAEVMGQTPPPEVKSALQWQKWEEKLLAEKGE